MKRMIVTLVGLMVTFVTARAQELPFEKGSWVLQPTVSFINGDEGFFGDTVEGGSMHLGLGYYFDDGWGAYVSVAGYHMDQHDADADVDGGGFDLMLRWHFLRREHWTVFIDGGGGLVRFDGEFPAFGTHSNFTARVGLGATVRIAEDLHLIGAVRYFHLSNAARHGQDENPSVDAVELSVGLVWEW